MFTTKRWGNWRFECFVPRTPPLALGLRPHRPKGYGSGFGSEVGGPCSLPKFRMFPQFFLICFCLILMRQFTTFVHHRHEHLDVPSFPQTASCSLSPYDIRELKQTRRRQKREPHKFAYLTMENSIFARFARAYFIFWHLKLTFSFFLRREMTSFVV